MIARPSRIGIVGLGKMGLPMARHLISAGFEVHGIDLNPDAIQRAMDEGVTIHPHAESMAETTDGTLVVVGFDDEVLETCLGEHGLMSGAGSGHVIFVCSTVRPVVSVSVGREAAARGVHVMDATLCRSEHAAIAANLLVLLGGDREVFDGWLPAFEAFASDVEHVGPLGTGQIAKTLNNALLWSAVVSNAEILRLGMRHGIDQETLRRALLLSSGANWALDTWRRTRPMPWAEKDMEIALELGEEVGLDLPLSEEVADLIARTKQQKAGESGGPDLSRASMSDFLESSEGHGRPD